MQSASQWPNQNVRRAGARMLLAIILPLPGLLCGCVPVEEDVQGSPAAAEGSVQGLLALLQDLDPVVESIDVGVEEGMHAPNFAARTLTGESIELAQFRGRYVLLVFCASWCVPCRAEVPYRLDVYEQFTPHGLVMIGINADEDAETAAAYAADEGEVWRQVWDGRWSDDGIYTLYEIDAIPANVLIDPDGVIVARDLRGDALIEGVAQAMGVPVASRTQSRTR